MRYAKYHALGNDYVVIRPAELDRDLSRDVIRLICHRNYGIGADGILLGPIDSNSCDFGLRIFNPDGSAIGMVLVSDDVERLTTGVVEEILESFAPPEPETAFAAR